MGTYHNILSFNNFQPPAGTLSPTGLRPWSSALFLIEQIDKTFDEARRTLNDFKAKLDGLIENEQSEAEEQIRVLKSSVNQWEGKAAEAKEMGFETDDLIKTRKDHI